MKFIDDLSFRKTDGGLVMLYKKKDGTLFELNETASTIAELIANGNADINSISDALFEIYDSEKEIIRKEVESTVAEFTEYGIIESL